MRKKSKHFEKCIDCGCVMHSEKDKTCSWCKDKKKSKKKIDDYFLQRGNISINSSRWAVGE